MSEADIIALGRNTSPDWHEDEFPAWVAGKCQVDPDAMPDYRTPWQESLRAITAPILLIRGEPARGGLVTAEIADAAMALNPNITTVLIPNAGHNIRRENFDGYLATVRGFLASN